MVRLKSVRGSGDIEPGQGRSAMREPKTPRFRGLQLPVWNLGSRPWEGTTKDIRFWGVGPEEESLPGRSKAAKGLGVYGDLPPPPLRVYFGNRQEICALLEFAFPPSPNVSRSCCLQDYGSRCVVKTWRGIVAPCVASLTFLFEVVM